MRYTSKTTGSIFTVRKMSVAMAAVLLGAVCLLPKGGNAQVTGQCVSCHTMHNSQGGASMNPALASTVYRSLTRGDCVGCHTATSDIATSTDGKTPYVNHTVSDPTQYLAGGSFAWMGSGGTGKDALGHNVAGISSSADGTLGLLPPGGSTLTNSIGLAQMTCAGTMGCHGTRSEDDEFKALSGSHHAPKQNTNGYVDGGSVANSFRFLDKVKGIEDSDWEKGVTASGGTDHNQYYGTARTSAADPAVGTISALCGQCHGTFHAAVSTNPTAGTGISYTDTMASPWVRHPTDFDMFPLMVTGKEYNDYGGATNAYQAQAPVASSNVSSATTPLATVKSAGNAIVTCISCHRAHGSKHADLLRWDYTAMNAHASAGGDVGCFACHTTKDT